VAPRKLSEDANLLSRIFLWVGGEHYIRARVNWVDFYAKKEVGGLRLVDPIEKPMVALPCKWAVMALEPGESSLKTLPCYKLSNLENQVSKPYHPTNSRPAASLLAKRVGTLTLIGPWLENTSPHQDPRHGVKLCEHGK